MRVQSFQRHIDTTACTIAFQVLVWIAAARHLVMQRAVNGQKMYLGNGVYRPWPA